MAGETTPPGGATRFFETTRGLLSYSQLAPLLAERVLGMERAIASGISPIHGAYYFSPNKEASNSKRPSNCR